MLDLIAQVKAFKNSNLLSARALQNSGAPISAVNDLKTKANNAVSLLEAYICFTNMAASGWAVDKTECEKIAKDHHDKLMQLMAA